MQPLHQPPVSSVLVIGAGIAGLQAARALKKRGFEVLLIDKADTVGGLWAKRFHTSSFGVQVPYEYYQLPEYPWPSHVKKDTYPTNVSVFEYCQAYAEHFNLLPHIRFNCQLARIQQRKPSGWHVVYLDVVSGFFEEIAVDYVVVCTGICSLPYIPNYPGADKFKGKQLHAKQFTDVSIVAGKRVVVLGAGKSALDRACELASSRAAASVTWLFRQAHWPVPRHFSKGLPMQKLVYSKLPLLLLPPYYTSGRGRAAAQKLLGPWQHLAWRWLEKAVASQFAMEGCLRPNLPIEQDLFYGGQILDSTWYRLVDTHHAAAAASAADGSSSSSKGGGGSSWLQCFTGSASAAGVAEGGVAPGGAAGGGGSSGVAGLRGLPSSSVTKPRASEDSVRVLAGGDSSTSCGSSRSSAHAAPLVSPAAAKHGGGKKSWPFMSGVFKPKQQQQQSQGQEAAAPGGSSSGADTQAPAAVGGAIRPMHGMVLGFTEDGLRLTSGEVLEADVVLYCTGFSKSYDYLEGQVKAKLGLCKDGLYLYRNVLPPRVSGIAFVGSEVSTYNNPLTSGLQAEWLARVLAGELALPPMEDMLADIRRLQQWRRTVMPAQRNRAAVYQLYMSKFHNQLMKDMGFTPPKPGPLSLLTPIAAAAYAAPFQPPSSFDPDFSCRGYEEHKAAGAAAVATAGGSCSSSAPFSSTRVGPGGEACLAVKQGLELGDTLDLSLLQQVPRQASMAAVAALKSRGPEGRAGAGSVGLVAAAAVAAAAAGEDGPGSFSGRPEASSSAAGASSGNGAPHGPLGTAAATAAAAGRDGSGRAGSGAPAGPAGLEVAASLPAGTGTAVSPFAVAAAGAAPGVMCSANPSSASLQSWQGQGMPRSGSGLNSSGRAHSGLLGAGPAPAQSMGASVTIFSFGGLPAASSGSGGLEADGSIVAALPAISPTARGAAAAAAAALGPAAAAGRAYEPPSRSSSGGPDTAPCVLMGQSRLTAAALAASPPSRVRFMDAAEGLLAGTALSGDNAVLAGRVGQHSRLQSMGSGAGGRGGREVGSWDMYPNSRRPRSSASGRPRGQAAAAGRAAGEAAGQGRRGGGGLLAMVARSRGSSGDAASVTSSNDSGGGGGSSSLLRIAGNAFGSRLGPAKWRSSSKGASHAGSTGNGKARCSLESGTSTNKDARSAAGSSGSGSGLSKLAGGSWPNRQPTVPLGGDHAPEQDPLAPVRLLVMQLQEQAEYEKEQADLRQGALAVAAAWRASGDSQGSATPEAPGSPLPPRQEQRGVDNNSCFTMRSSAPSGGAVGPSQGRGGRQEVHAATGGQPGSYEHAGGMAAVAARRRNALLSLGPAALAGAADQAMRRCRQAPGNGGTVGVTCASATYDTTTTGTFAQAAAAAARPAVAPRTGFEGDFVADWVITGQREEEQGIASGPCAVAVVPGALDADANCSGSFAITAPGGGPAGVCSGAAAAGLDGLEGWEMPARSAPSATSYRRRSLAFEPQVAAPLLSARELRARPGHVLLPSSPPSSGPLPQRLVVGSTTSPPNSGPLPQHLVVPGSTTSPPSSGPLPQRLIVVGSTTSVVS